MKKGKHTYYFLFLGLLILTITSCRKTFSTGQPVDDKRVVLAEITAGDSMKIPVGKTIKVGGGGIIRFEKVNDASVTINDQFNHHWVLQPSWSTQYASNPTTVYTNRLRFRSSYTYDLTIKHPTLGTATATAIIPALPVVTSFDTTAATYQGNDVLGVNICWKGSPDKNEYYIIEVLKQLVKVEHYFNYHGVHYNYDSPQGKAFYEQVKNNPAV